MKAFVFSKSETKKVVNAYNDSLYGMSRPIVDVMALSIVHKCYGLRRKVYVFKTYHSNDVFIWCSVTDRILSFPCELDAYKFILVI